MASGEVDITPGYQFSADERLTIAKLNLLVAGLLLRIKEGSITTRELADGSISSDKLAVDLAAQLALADGAVTTAKLAATAVTSAKIADDAVTAGKAAPDMIHGQTPITVGKAGSELLVWDVDTSDLRLLTIGNLHPSGSIVQSVYFEEGTNANIPTAIPYDDSIPQVTEGNQIAAATITPKYADSKIMVHFSGVADTNPDDNVTVALFRDGAADAKAAASVRTQADPSQIVLNFRDAPGTTDEVTYTIRAGAAGGGTNLAFNGLANPSRRLGGVAKNVLILQEVRA